MNFSPKIIDGLTQRFGQWIELRVSQAGGQINDARAKAGKAHHKTQHAHIQDRGQSRELLHSDALGTERGFAPAD